MCFKSEFEIERYGIAQTILAVNPNVYVKGYCEQLLELSFDADLEMIKVLLSKLLSWYDEGNYEELLTNKYVFDKEIHQKTYKLLKYFIKVMKNNYVKPTKKIRRSMGSKDTSFDIDVDLTVK